MEEKKNVAGAAGGTLVNFVLLEQPAFDREQLIRDLQKEWGLPVNGEKEAPATGNVVFDADGMIAAVALIDAPVPEREAEQQAKTNYWWEEAVQAAAAHRAHLLITVLPQGQEGPVEAAKLLTKVSAAACGQPGALGVMAAGTLLAPDFYRAVADTMREDVLPILNWVYFGLWQSEQGVCAYTYGLQDFELPELEILHSARRPVELRDLLANLVMDLLEGEVELAEGQVLAMGDGTPIPVSRSAGVAVEGESLKLGF